MNFQSPCEIALEFERWMNGTVVPFSRSLDKREWLRFYLDFCPKSAVVLHALGWLLHQVVVRTCACKAIRAILYHTEPGIL